MYSKIEREGKHHHWFDSDNNNDKQKLILEEGNKTTADSLCQIQRIFMKIMTTATKTTRTFVR